MSETKPAIVRITLAAGAQTVTHDMHAVSFEHGWYLAGGVFTALETKKAIWFTDDNGRVLVFGSAYFISAEVVDAP